MFIIRPKPVATFSWKSVLFPLELFDDVFTKMPRDVRGILGLL
jgi:hypothetical protein